MSHALQLNDAESVEVRWGFGANELDGTAKEGLVRIIHRHIDYDETLRETTRVRVHRSTSRLPSSELANEHEERYIVEFFSADNRVLSPDENLKMVLMVRAHQAWSLHELKRSKRKTGVVSSR